MWVTEDRVFHRERIGRSDLHVAPALRTRIARLSSVEQVRLERGLRSRFRLILEELVETYPEVNPAAEAEFVAKMLPDEFVLHVGPGEDDLVACITRQVAAAPPRWRLDLVGVAGDYVSDFGPSYWKWRWINFRLTREDERDRRRHRDAEQPATGW